MKNREKIAKEILILHEFEKRICEKSFYEFFKRSWVIIEPRTPFKDNWHFKYLCDIFQNEVERIAARKPKTKDFIVNISPRSSKSTIVSIALTPWAWTRFPFLRFINSCHTEELSTYHCVQSRTIIDSYWYQQHWGEVFNLRTDQNVKTFFVNDKRGHRIATSVGSSNITGQGADIVIGDDLLSPKKAASETSRRAANEHWDYTLHSRLNDWDVGVRIMVQQRLHVDDPTGHLLKTDPDNYKLICIPGELNDTATPEIVPYYKDGLFFPNRFSKKALESMKRTLGSFQYSAQILQNPVSDEGNVVKKSWFKFYRTPPMTFDRIIQSWDMSFEEGGEKSTNSFVVCQIWGKIGVNAYLLYQLRKRMGFVDTLKKFGEVSEQFPKAITKLIERKANGHGIFDVVRSKIVGVKPVDPKKHGSKEVRFQAVAPIIESGFVYLPDPEEQQWVSDEYLAELTSFPNSEYDDQVDATSQALSELFKLSDTMYEDLLKM